MKEYMSINKPKSVSRLLHISNRNLRNIIQNKSDLELLEHISIQINDKGTNWLARKIIGEENQTNVVSYESGKILINKFDGDSAYSEGFGGCLMAVFKLNLDNVDEDQKNAFKYKFQISEETTPMEYVAHIFTSTRKADDCKEIFLYACKKKIFTNVHWFKPIDYGLIRRNKSEYIAYTAKERGKEDYTEILMNSGDNVIDKINELIRLSSEMNYPSEKGCCSVQ